MGRWRRRIWQRVHHPGGLTVSRRHVRVRAGRGPILGEQRVRCPTEDHAVDRSQNVVDVRLEVIVDEVPVDLVVDVFYEAVRGSADVKKDLSHAEPPSGFCVRSKV